MNEKEAIGKLNEYLFSDHSYLSARTDYARGFKEGAGRVREIVSGILEDCGLLQAPRPMERYMQSLRKEGNLWSGDFDLLPDDVGRRFSKYERLEEEYDSMLSSGVRIPPDERKELEEELKEARKKFSASLEEAAATYWGSVKGTEEREKEEYSRYKLPDGVTKDNLAVDIAADAEEGRGTVRAFFSADGYKDSASAALSPGDFKAVWEEGKATPEQMAAKYLGAEIREMRDLSRGEITAVGGGQVQNPREIFLPPVESPLLHGGMRDGRGVGGGSVFPPLRQEEELPGKREVRRRGVQGAVAGGGHVGEVRMGEVQGGHAEALAGVLEGPEGGGGGGAGEEVHEEGNFRKDAVRGERGEGAESGILRPAKVAQRDGDVIS